MATLLVSRFMTVLPVHIGPLHTLAQAHVLMNRHSIRHLPVVEDGRLVGLLSMSDLHLIETLRDVDPELVQIEDAMSPEPLAVRPEQPVDEVAEQMVERKIGSAVVMDGGNVVGMFTTGDALRALVALVRDGG